MSLTQEQIKKELEKDIEKVNKGCMDFKEYKRRRYRVQQLLHTPRLIECAEHGDWKRFIDISLSFYEVMPIAFRYFSEIPDDLKYRFAIDAYIHHGDSIPAVRKAVRSALRYGKPDLPKELAVQEEIVVYRAGEEPIQKAKYRISWTTDKEVALFFHNEWNNRHANHLYQARIKTKHIIGYTDEREEKEVLQYRRVYDIKEILDDDLEK